MSELWYSLLPELSPSEEEFFSLVVSCNLPGIETFLEENTVNINMKNYQGITPLHVAIQNDCETLVEFFLNRKGERVYSYQLLIH